jgi:hypothetical protein
MQYSWQLKHVIVRYGLGEEWGDMARCKVSGIVAKIMYSRAVKHNPRGTASRNVE